tara:strand:- start:60 stop:221 length:162 start_codon:yes stop_codon:yes gene_type:complete
MINQLEMFDDVVWFNYKGYDIRIEKNEEYNNGNLLITVTPKGCEDYVGRLEVE